MNKSRILIIAIIFLLFSPYQTFFAEEDEELEVSIRAIPNNVLFNASNLKPGDTMTRTMTIMNEGNSEYYYSFDAEYISGSQELYEQFELTVTGGEGLLFEGSLAEFTELEPRFLNAGTEEELQFVAEFPFESGNEFQGLEVQFKFVLNAQAEESSLPGGPGSVLPETATLSYMFLFFGLSLFGIGGVLYVINKRLDSPRTFKNIT